MASLLSTGRQIKGSALAGLTSVAQQEASKNIAEEQLKQAAEAQSQQLIGTGLGVAGAYAAPKVAASMASRKALADVGLAGADMFAAPGSQAATSVAAIPAEVAAGTATATEAAAVAEGGTAAAGGTTALLTNPYTYAAIAAAFLLKKIFD